MASSLPPKKTTVPAMPFRVGSRVIVSTKKGEVRFIGPTQFATDTWVGIHLDQPDGKNDGTIDGVFYFQSDAKHGLFVRPVAVKLDPTAPVSSRIPTGTGSTAPKSRLPALKGATPVTARHPEPVKGATATVARHPEPKAAVVGKQARSATPTGRLPEPRTATHTPHLVPPEAPVASAAASEVSSELASPGPAIAESLSLADSPDMPIGPGSPNVLTPSASPAHSPLPSADIISTIQLPATAEPIAELHVPDGPGTRGSPADLPAASAVAPATATGRSSAAASPSLTASAARSPDPFLTAFQLPGSGSAAPAPAPPLSVAPVVLIAPSQDEPVSQPAVASVLAPPQQQQPAANSFLDAFASAAATAAPPTPSRPVANNTLAPSETSRPIAMSAPTEPGPARFAQEAPGPAMVPSTPSKTETGLPSFMSPTSLVPERIAATPNLVEKQQSLMQKIEAKNVLKTGPSIEELNALKKQVESQNETIKDLNKQIKKVEKDSQTAVKELQSQITEMEAKDEEQRNQLEMMALDKDLAEENAEQLTNQVASLASELRETKTELDLIKEVTEAKRQQMIASLPSDQAEVAKIVEQNEKLTRTLRQFRDTAVADKARLEEKVTGLNAENENLRSQATELSSVKKQLAVANRNVEELKSSLDETHGFETMVEELSEKNLTLGERVVQIESEVKHLRELQSASEDVEDGHVEFEAQLQKEIDDKDTQLINLRRDLLTKQTKIDDLYSTVRQFRQKVQDMEGNAEELKGKEEDFESQARQSVEWQRRMRANVTKLQSRLKDLWIHLVSAESVRVDAVQCRQREAFLKAHIPANVVGDDRTLSYLLSLERVRSKSVSGCRLLHGFFGNAVDVSAEQEVIKIVTALKIADTLLNNVRSLTRMVAYCRTATPEALQAMMAKSPELFTASESSLDKLHYFIASADMSSAALDVTSKSTQLLDAVTAQTVGALAGAEAELPAVDALQVWLRLGAIGLHVRSIGDLVGGADAAKDSALLQVQQFANQLDDIQQNAYKLSQQLVQAVGATQKVSQSAEQGLHTAQSVSVLVQERVSAVRQSVLISLQSSSSSKTTSAAPFASPQKPSLRANSEAVNTVGRLLASEVTGTKGAYDLLNSLVGTLQTLISSLAVAGDVSANGEIPWDTILPPFVLVQESGQAAWEQRAAVLREDLKQAAATSAALDEMKKRMEEKSRDVFQAKKETRQIQDKLDVLQSKLAIVQAKAEGNSSFADQVERLKGREKELEAAAEIIRKDLEKYIQENKVLKRKAGVASKFHADDSEEPASAKFQGADTQTMMRTIRSLRLQLSSVREQHSAQQLARLGPLQFPVTQSREVLGTTGALWPIQSRLAQLAQRVSDLRISPTLVRLDALDRKRDDDPLSTSSGDDESTSTGTRSSGGITDSAGSVRHLLARLLEAKQIRKATQEAVSQAHVALLTAVVQSNANDEDTA